MSKRPERVSSYPPIYFQVFMRVAQTGQDLIINNLENRQTAYVSLRARLSAFRKAYAEEAEASSDAHMKQMAADMYAVTLCNPEQIDGKWALVMRPKGYKFADTLAEALEQHDKKMEAEGVSLPPTPLAVGRPLVGSTSGSVSIADLYGIRDQEDGGIPQEEGSQ